MHMLIHAGIGILAALLLRLQSWEALLFIAASVFIDLDHIVDFKKSGIQLRHIWNIQAFKQLNYKTCQQHMHLFHTFEVITIIALFSIWWQPAGLIALAFAIHLLTDAWGNIWNRNIMKHAETGWLRQWFLLTYLLLRKDKKHIF